MPVPRGFGWHRQTRIALLSIVLRVVDAKARRQCLAEIATGTWCWTVLSHDAFSLAGSGDLKMARKLVKCEE
eukprot:4501202-Amphidinium_carterae.1